MSKSWLASSDEALWASRIQRALEWRKHYTFEQNWPRIDAYYRHQFEEVESTLPRFNLIYMMGQTLIPNLVFQSPGIINTPTRSDMTYMASIWDSIDNWWIRKSEMRDIAKEVVLSSYLHNTTAVQIGMDIGEMGQLRDDLFASEDGEYNRTRGNNVPWVDSIPSHRFVLAIGTRSMRNARWGAKLISVPTKVLKKQKGLKNVVATELPPEVLRMEAFTWEKREKDQWTHFWEIHDAETGKQIWLGTHGKFILPPEKDELQVYGLPFEVVSFNRNVDSLYGTPDAEYIRSQQMEGDEVRQHSMYMRRFSLPKCIYDSNVIKPKDMERMLEATVAPAIPANLGDGGEDDIRKHVFPFTPPTSFMLHREYAKDLLNDAQLINGFGPNQMGTFAPGRRTKYETQVVESNNTTRLAYRRTEIGDMIKGMVHRANILMSKHWTEDVVHQVVGVDGALYWVKAGPDQLKNIEDGLVTEVNVESLAPVSRERRKMEAANLLGLLANMQTAGMNTMPLIKQLLSTYEWIDLRQVLPQMSGEYEAEAWAAGQQQMIQGGGQGPAAAQNLGGVQSLMQKLPAESEGNMPPAPQQAQENEAVRQ